MNGRHYIDSIVSKGKYYFTTQGLEKDAQLSPVAANAKLYRLRKDHEIATPHQGFHLILPPEYRSLGCLPATHFIADLMKYLETPYYVGLLSAAELYGAAHQKPQIFQVILPEARKSIHCGKIRIKFIKRRDMGNMPTRQMKTTTGYILVSTPEVTALDIVNYPLRAGGTNNIVTVLQELIESFDKKALQLLMPAIEATPQLQRLGFFLDTLGFSAFAAVIFTELQKRRTNPIFLISKSRSPILSYDKKWKVNINETWESDL